MKRHWQTHQVYAAEDRVKRPGGLPWSKACALAKQVCEDYELPVANVVAGDALVVARDRVTLPKPHPRAVSVLHALAHVLTDPAFPPHGAEFCARWLELCDRYAPATGKHLRSALEDLGVHHTAEGRARTARGNATYKATHRRGTVVEVVLDDPPECKRGSIEEVDGDELVLGGDRLPLDRVRYIYEWGTAR